MEWMYKAAKVTLRDAGAEKDTIKISGRRFHRFLDTLGIAGHLRTARHGTRPVRSPPPAPKVLAGSSLCPSLPWDSAPTGRSVWTILMPQRRRKGWGHHDLAGPASFTVRFVDDRLPLLAKTLDGPVVFPPSMLICTSTGPGIGTDTCRPHGLIPPQTSPPDGLIRPLGSLDKEPIATPRRRRHDM